MVREGGIERRRGVGGGWQEMSLQAAEAEAEQKGFDSLVELFRWAALGEEDGRSNSGAAPPGVGTAGVGVRGG